MGGLDHLRDRKLIRWAAAYLATGWVLLQLVDVLGPRWGLTDVGARMIDVAVVVGFGLTLLLAWFHGEEGRQTISGPEVLLVGMVLAAGGVGLALIWDRSEDVAVVQFPPTLERSSPAVAVLPLDNLSLDPDDAYFADGIHEEIVSRLGTISSLFVMARASVVRFEDSDLSLREIAQQLGVDYLITGSVRTSGQEVRLATQLIDGETEGHLWSETYERDLTVGDLFAIQSDLALQVSNALSARILPDEAASIATRPTSSTEAYQHYLRGLSHWGRRTAIDNRVAAVEAFRDATAADEQFGEGWAMLAAASLWLRWYDANGAGDGLAARGISRDGLFDEGESALHSAEALAPGSAATALAKGYYQYYGLRDFEEALATFTAADRRFPGNAGLTSSIGSVLRRMGRYDEALAWYLQAAALGPSPQVFYTAGQTAQMMRRYDQALELADQAINLAPDFGPALNVRVNVYQMAGDTAAAWEAIEAYRSATGSPLNGRRVEMVRFRGGHSAALEEFAKTYGEDRSSVNYLLHLRRAGQGVPEAAADAVVEEAQRKLSTWRGVADPFVVIRARADLALALAAAGRPKQALEEAEWVLEQEPMSRDALIGWTAVHRALLASLLARDEVLALRAVDMLLGLPSFRSTAWLTIDPVYGSLWDLPSFRRLIERYRSASDG